MRVAYTYNQCLLRGRLRHSVIHGFFFTGLSLLSCYLGRPIWEFAVLFYIRCFLDSLDGVVARQCGVTNLIFSVAFTSPPFVSCSSSELRGILAHAFFAW